jgi:hypothetical protein
MVGGRQCKRVWLLVGMAWGEGTAVVLTWMDGFWGVQALPSAGLRVQAIPKNLRVQAIPKKSHQPRQGNGRKPAPKYPPASGNL